MDHAQIVVRVRQIGIQTQRLTLALLRLVGPAERKNRQPEVHPGFLEVRIEGQGFAVGPFRFGQATLAMERKAPRVFDLRCVWVHTTAGCIGL